MHLVPPTIEAYQVQHLPIVQACADKISLVKVINEVVPTEMAIDPGTIVLGMILDTFIGRSPLYRLEEFFAHLVWAVGVLAEGLGIRAVARVFAGDAKTVLVTALA